MEQDWYTLRYNVTEELGITQIFQNRFDPFKKIWVYKNSRYLWQVWRQELTERNLLNHVLDSLLNECKPDDGKADNLRQEHEKKIMVKGNSSSTDCAKPILINTK